MPVTFSHMTGRSLDFNRVLSGLRKMCSPSLETKTQAVLADCLRGLGFDNPALNLSLE